MSKGQKMIALAKLKRPDIFAHNLKMFSRTLEPTLPKIVKDVSLRYFTRLIYCIASVIMLGFLFFWAYAPKRNRTV